MIHWQIVTSAIVCTKRITNERIHRRVFGTQPPSACVWRRSPNGVHSLDEAMTVMQGGLAGTPGRVRDFLVFDLRVVGALGVQ